MKRTTALILALLMCVSMMPNVFAFTPETVESAAETVPGSESAALAVSNDPAVLGDNYLVDGLGKALLYVSGETMKYDFLDSTYITGHKIYDDGARDIQYFEAGSSASLASDPKDAGKTVTKLVTGSAYDGYGFGAEGDWKTAALLRAMKVMADGLGGGTADHPQPDHDRRARTHPGRRRSPPRTR